MLKHGLNLGEPNDIWKLPFNQIIETCVQKCKTCKDVEACNWNMFLV